MFQTNRGFTLIELMTVIAIIGILVGIVLVAFPQAQDRAKDGRIMNNMDQLRIKMEGCKANNAGNYEGPFSCDNELVTDINSQSPGTLNAVTSSSAYCMDVQLNDGNYWCIDSSLSSCKGDSSSCTAADDTCDCGDSVPSPSN